MVLGYQNIKCLGNIIQFNVSDKITFQDIKLVSTFKTSFHFTVYYSC